MALTWLFAESKMRGLFTLLFGAGVILLTERVEKRGGSRRAAVIFYRRNLWLLLFGLCHAFFIWFGDVLFTYAVTGLLFLYPLRRLSARKLITIGLILWVGVGSLTRVQEARARVREAAQLTDADAAGADATPQQRALEAADRQSRWAASGQAVEDTRLERIGYVGGFRHNLGEWLGFMSFLLNTLRGMDTVGAMILGMGLYKAGFLTGRRPVREYVLLALGGYTVTGRACIGRPLACFPVRCCAFGRDAMDVDPGRDCGAVRDRREPIPDHPAGARRRAGVHIPAARGRVGRTALSNYILTSLLCKFLFSWGPWKLYDRLDFPQWFLVTGAIWALNLVLSTLWLRAFAFGSLEWLWRSLTYRKRQPFLLRDVQA